jgi:hypothetical protein
VNEISHNDVAAIGGGSSRCGKGVRAQSSTPAVAAGFPADAGSEGGAGAE